ncbi:AN1-type zinc finger protein 2B isoform X2 [Marmota marmota marmota]|uniref:AN1-type zinc finger protein 2B isoform X2 n=1 Tax=Marmota marmota marmota TaxID=9994 RepID=UPI00209263F9|nr:AN1-type zinc finger protein 2B isoform X2 [Marmota marmota marmota]
MALSRLCPETARAGRGPHCVMTSSRPRAPKEEWERWTGSPEALAPPGPAMEFPDLGAHCSEPSCQRLDFLPLKCDACSGIFCADHVAYAQHHCGSAYQKDIQVPVCPLCNVPVPVARGEPPDRAVGEHIDRDCRSDPAQQKRKIFTNKCERSGCRQREMMKLTCERCGRNFCIKHRHPLDHDCSGEGHPTSKAGLAAISRSQGLASSASTIPSPSRTLPSSTSPSRATTQSPSRTVPPVITLQNGLSEDEALQRALELSLAETKPQIPSSQEEEDLALAQALSASEAEYQRQQAQSRSLKPSNCSLC